MQNYNHTYRLQDSGEGIFYGWFEAMHSRFDLLIAGMDEQSAQLVTDRICVEAARLDRKLSRFDQRGDIYALNTLSYYTMFHADGELLEILEDALRFRELTEGSFDICVSTPQYDKTETYYSVDHNSKAVVLVREGVVFDLGGYAKGLVLERAKDMLIEEGVRDALVSFGGSSVYAIGQHPSGVDWSVGVDNPFFGKERVAQFDLCNHALSTSGNAPGNMGHIISPTTGEKIDTLRLISICGKSPLACEVLSTALFALGDDEQMRDRVLARCGEAGIITTRLVEANFASTFDTVSVRELI